MQYDNKGVLGDFNLKPRKPIMFDFLNDYNFTNFIKRNTYLNGHGCCIDLILTSCKYSFKFFTTF